jgi:hypothetical protein
MASMTKPDPLRERIEAFGRAHGGISVHRARGGYTLVSLRTGVPMARLRPTGEGDKVQVLWWAGERWRAPGPFGTPTMPLERALDFIASEPAFWINA